MNVTLSSHIFYIPTSVLKKKQTKNSVLWFDPWSGKIPHCLEKEMETHSSNLAVRIPWTEERGLLQSTGSQRGDHDVATEQQQQ